MGFIKKMFKDDDEDRLINISYLPYEIEEEYFE